MSYHKIAVLLITSLIGMGYFMYGKRRPNIIFLVTGIALTGYAYFIDSYMWLSIVGIILIAIPFIIKR